MQDEGHLSALPNSYKNDITSSWVQAQATSNFAPQLMPSIGIHPIFSHHPVEIQNGNDERTAISSTWNVPLGYLESQRIDLHCQNSTYGVDIQGQINAWIADKIMLSKELVDLRERQNLHMSQFHELQSVTHVLHEKTESYRSQAEQHLTDTQRSLENIRAECAKNLRLHIDAAREIAFLKEMMYEQLKNVVDTMQRQHARDCDLLRSEVQSLRVHVDTTQQKFDLSSVPPTLLNHGQLQYESCREYITSRSSLLAKAKTTRQHSHILTHCVDDEEPFVDYILTWLNNGHNGAYFERATGHTIAWENAARSTIDESDSSTLHVFIGIYPNGWESGKLSKLYDLQKRGILSFAIGVNSVEPNSCLEIPMAQGCSTLPEDHTDIGGVQSIKVLLKLCARTQTLAGIDNSGGMSNLVEAIKASSA